MGRRDQPDLPEPRDLLELLGRLDRRERQGRLEHRDLQE